MSSWISCLWQVLQRLAFSFLIRFGCSYWYIMMSKIPTTNLLWYSQCLVFANGRQSVQFKYPKSCFTILVSLIRTVSNWPIFGSLVLNCWNRVTLILCPIVGHQGVAC